MIRSRTHLYEREQVVPFGLGDVFELFADARNLELITPHWLAFRILRAPSTLEAGSKIDYRLTFRGVPLRWASLIAAWEPPHRFVDTQVRGPYAMWEHTHEFEAINGSTRIRDQVRYRQSLGPLGEFAERTFARRDIERIFDHREAATLHLLEARAGR